MRPELSFCLFSLFLVVLSPETSLTSLMSCPLLSFYMFVLFILPVPSSLSASVSVLDRPHDEMSHVFVFQMFHQLKQQRSYFIPEKATDLTFETTSAADEWDVFMGRRLSSLLDYFSFFGFETIRLKVCGSVLSRPLRLDFFSFSGLKCEMRPDWWRQRAWEDEIGGSTAENVSWLAADCSECLQPWQV